MGVMADRLKGVAVRVPSPDGQIEGAYSPADGVGIQFHGDGFRNYTERGLERQLGGLAALLWTAYRRDCETVVAEVSGSPVDEKPWDANCRRFRAERADTVAVGMSAGEFVYFESIGMRDWWVVVRDGALTELDEAAFAAEFTSGHEALLRDYRYKLACLRVKHYGPDFWMKK